MNKARPKSFVIYSIKTFSGDAECWISCYPQQRWEYEVKENKVTLRRKGITLIIPKVDFEKRWKVVQHERSNN